jgi:hypothetical protein
VTRECHPTAEQATEFRDAANSGPTSRVRAARAPGFGLAMILESDKADTGGVGVDVQGRQYWTCVACPIQSVAVGVGQLNTARAT